MTVFRSLRAAFVFLTRIPAGGFPYSPEEWAWSAAHFPFVGAVVGALGAVAYVLLLPLGAAAAAVFALASTLLVTGAFHEDGLADTSDALGGGDGRDQVFAILKDSRIGTFGALALIVSFAGRAALLVALGGRAPGAFVLASTIGRLGPVWLMVALPYATSHDTAKSRPVTLARAPQALLATAWSGLVAAVLLVKPWVPPSRVGAVVAACAVVTALTGARYARRVGGVTGDFLGATEQLCELSALAVMAWP